MKKVRVDSFLADRPEARRAYIGEKQSQAFAVEAAMLIRLMRETCPRDDGELGITQTELGRRMGVTQERISALESAVGRDGPSYAMVRRVAEACGFPWPRVLTVLLPQVQPTVHLAEPVRQDTSDTVTS